MQVSAISKHEFLIAWSVLKGLLSSISLSRFRKWPQNRTNCGLSFIKNFIVYVFPSSFYHSVKCKCKVTCTFSCLAYRTNCWENICVTVFSILILSEINQWYHENNTERTCIVQLLEFLLKKVWKKSFSIFFLSSLWNPTTEE